MLAQAVLMAGTDTTRNQLACSVALFAEHPDQWRLLAAQPALAPRAVEESMRYLGAVRATVRFASEDVSYRGVLFPQGTIVSTSLAGANRDPEVWQEPNRFDITKERGTAQMTFGSGSHFCLGAALAPRRVARSTPPTRTAPARACPHRTRRMETGQLRHLGSGAASPPLRRRVARSAASPAPLVSPRRRATIRRRLRRTTVPTTPSPDRRAEPDDRPRRDRGRTRVTTPSF